MEHPFAKRVLSTEWAAHLGKALFGSSTTDDEVTIGCTSICEAANR